MSRRIVIADATPTNRIALKAALSAARYDVRTVASGPDCLAALGSHAPDMVLIDGDMPGLAADALCREIRSADRPAIPVVMSGRCDPETRLAFLAAGAGEVICRPFDRAWLLTNLRAILRMEESAAELRRRAVTAERLGFAEAPAHFRHQMQIAVVSDDRTAATTFRRSLPELRDICVKVQAPSDSLDEASGGSPPDVFAICANAETDIEAALWLISELRSLPHARHAPILFSYEPGLEAAATRALDLGANEVVLGDATGAERALRLERQTERRREAIGIEAQLDAGLRLAARDDLTGLWSRRYAMHHLTELSTRPHAEGRALGVIMADLDRFKAVNDTWGHAAGDQVLKEIARRITGNMRQMDLVARIGGEELLIVLPDCAPEEAMRSADRLRRAVSDVPIQIGDGRSIRMTLSLGVCCRPGLPVDTMLAQADAALYAAKNTGRNRSHMADPAPRARAGRRGSVASDQTGAGPLKRTHRTAQQDTSDAL